MHGYKCFNSDMTNIYGDKFELGKKYFLKGELKIGTRGNGFHIAENLEDTLKYYGALNPDIVVCEVFGSGDMLSDWDDYYGFLKYAVSELEIVRIIPREEIIQMALQFNEDRAFRFVQLFKLTEEEIKLFDSRYAKYIRVLKAIEYYQKGNKNIYKLDSSYEFDFYSKCRKKQL